MGLLNVKEIINVMKENVGASKIKQLYYNEADIQFAMAAAIKEVYHCAIIEMEVPIPFIDKKENRNSRADIVVTIGENVYAIELKYRRRGIKAYNGREMKGDNRDRTEFSRDLQRLEELVRGERSLYKQRVTAGYALWFTNDKEIWASDINTKKEAYKDDIFLSVKCGALLGGHTEPRIVKQYEEHGMKIYIRDKYKVAWEEFTDFDCENGLLKYAVIKVPN